MNRYRAVSTSGHRRGKPLLSTRQHEILALRENGNTIRQIAQKLGISANTVLRHSALARTTIRAKKSNQPDVLKSPIMRRREAILNWMSNELLPSLIQQHGKRITTREVLQIILNQFPNEGGRAFRKNYAERLVRILVNAGILKRNGKSAKTDYTIQWPPSPPIISK